MTKQILFAIVVCMACSGLLAQSDLVQVKADFSTDPGWDCYTNRVEASNPPTVRQDFGWSAGKIGGVIWKSTTPAWYGMKLDPPHSFDNAFTVSGKIAVKPVVGDKDTTEDAGAGTKQAAYLGFFNHQRQGWRPWSTMAVRIVNNGDKALFYLDCTSGLWCASGVAEAELEIPADGSQHTWTFSYDPEGRRAPWTDKNLHDSLSSARQNIDQILAKLKKLEPDVAQDDLEKRLDKARGLGLITFLNRHGQRWFLLKEEKADLRGLVSIAIDNQTPLQAFLSNDVRSQPVVLDRFGIYNMQLYHGAVQFYVSDLVFDGKKIDLSQDPGWEGQNNRTEFVEHDFQRQNFGYSANTSFAGGAKGEIGGEITNVEPIDPLHGYYADDVGKLTLDDPIHFAGKISYIEGSTDAGMFFGFFREADAKAELPPNVPGTGGSAWPQPNTLGIVIDGPAKIGWYFTAVCTAAGSPAQRKLSRIVNGPVFLPTRQPRTFDFNYDPKANNGIGRITVKLDEQSFTLDLTAQQRQAGASFDRFGMMSFRRGGKYEIVYLDDLSYTARRSPDYVPVRHEQQTVFVPYPSNGRKF